MPAYTHSHSPAIVAPGERMSLDVHVVNDRRSPVLDGIVDVTASWPGGSRHWRFGGDADADAVVGVGTVEFDVPATLGALTIDIRLTDDTGQIATNRYRTAITTP